MQSPDRVRVQHPQQSGWSFAWLSPGSRARAAPIDIVGPGRRAPHRSPTARSGGPVPPRVHFYAHAGRSRPVVGTAIDTGNSPDPADSGHCLPASASLHAPVRGAGSGRFHRPQIPDAPTTAGPCRTGLSVRVVGWLCINLSAKTICNDILKDQNPFPLIRMPWSCLGGIYHITFRHGFRSFFSASVEQSRAIGNPPAPVPPPYPQAVAASSLKFTKSCNK